MHKEILKAIKDFGWTVLNEEPLKMSHDNGSLVIGDIAEHILSTLNLPEIQIKWHHPIAQLTCVESSSHWPADDYGGHYGRPGDLWVEYGGWLGRREPNGFRVLATGTLVELDDSLWEEIEVIIPPKHSDNRNIDWSDDIAF